MSKGRTAKIIFEFTRAAVLGIAFALVLTCVFQPSRVQGTSMEPTVGGGNLVILNKASYWMAEPAYGDIVIFESHIFTDNGEGKMLIKRIIGLPGDEVEIASGAVYRNGLLLAEEYVSGVNPQESMEKVHVEQGCVFVLGDHRNVSLDSRDASIGQIPIADIVGKVSLRLYPFEQIGAIE